ncbi:hypothetical protein EZS27_017048 [termite gut metagenome]|uniref:Yip1 domain-containing protein n=1 Tax=termite gut metagenome TaxID=433724 RepID=A0A5J4RNJ6_9ZZZZ
MDYVRLFKTVWLLVSSSAHAWEEIRLEDKQKVFSAFVYPMIGFCGLSVFIRSLCTTGWSSPESFQTAMIECCAVAVSLFGGYFLAAYIINRIGVSKFNLDDAMPLMRQFAGYALGVTFLIRIVIGLFPESAIIGWILQFYIIYVVWEGVPIMMEVKEKDRFLFTILVSALLVVCPISIQIIFNVLMTIFH